MLSSQRISFLIYTHFSSIKLRVFCVVRNVNFIILRQRKLNSGLIRTEHQIQMKDTDTAYSFNCILKENSTVNTAMFGKVYKSESMADYR